MRGVEANLLSLERVGKTAKMLTLREIEHWRDHMCCFGHLVLQSINKAFKN
jgi:hypothetical protein